MPACEVTVRGQVALAVIDLIRDRFGEIAARPDSRDTVLVLPAFDAAAERALLTLLWDTGHEVVSMRSHEPTVNDTDRPETHHEAAPHTRHGLHSARTLVWLLIAAVRLPSTRPGAPGSERGPPVSRGPSCTEWQVKDSNLRSFRDGFTVHSHWPLGQPAVVRLEG